MTLELEGGGENQRTFSVAIVDDEAPARDLMRMLVEREPDCIVVAECGDVRIATKQIRDRKPDLVFLDIEMPGASGLELIRTFSELEKPPYVVFATAFNRYAIEAFELNAIDYIVKPVAKARCAAAIERVRQAIRKDTVIEMASRLMSVVNELNIDDAPPDREQSIILRKNSLVRSVLLSNIIWIEAANQYVKIHTVGDEYLMSESLGQFSRRIRDPQFVRIHRSAIVNGRHIDDVSKNKNGTYELILKNGEALTLARAKSSLLPKILRYAGMSNV